MNAEQREQMMKLAEGKSDGSTSVELSVDDLFSIVNDAMYPAMGTALQAYPGSGNGPSAKVLAALGGLGKLGYDKRDTDALSKYFDHCAKAEELRQDASRALGRMRDEYYMDKDRSGKAKSPYKTAY